MMLKMLNYFILLFVGVCGLVNAETLTMQPRIYGGKDTTSAEYPDYVLVRVGNFSCGGTVISPRWVMTAAHCITDESNNRIASPQTVKVYIAPWLKKDYVSKSTYIHFKKKIIAKRIVRHSGYNNTGVANDIALIELKEKAPVTPAILNDSSAGLVGSNAKIVGLGADFFGSEVFFDRQIQVATVPIIQLQDCKDAYTDGAPDTVICAGTWGRSWQKANGTCSGDSGGPLYVEKSGTRVQAGVTSFGAKSSCGKAAPGGFTDVSQYKAWLTQYASPRFYVSSAATTFIDGFE